eukprot:TRINITY_DN3006_c0_g1_i1.p1 TRINITY_DN3006_c0_g1~~TRINITY_DN3006_c0_g1_i1.p1  ORF type:complete len:522 (-),score=92.09 TRINITY_DN3006_c0_g1_i1:31-1455(-)
MRRGAARLLRVSASRFNQVSVGGKRNYSKYIEPPATTFKPQAYDGPTKDEVKQLRSSYLNPGIFAYYKDPVMIVEGKMQYLWDEKGTRYLDMFGGIVTVSVGHCHPKVVEAATKQVNKLMHTTTIYLHNEIAQFAAEMAKKLPDHPYIYFTNSGSEANDLAMLMARLHTGNDDFISLRNGYHGMGMNTMGLTALQSWRFPVSTPGSIRHAICPNTYRGPYLEGERDVAANYARDVLDVIQSSTPGQIAGFIAEYIQGVGGTVVLPDGYLEQVYEYVRAAKGVCIADEVQTGFGRLGTDFWGFQTQGIKPDIVTMAKGIGNGTPLAAVATTKEIAETMKQRLHFNTYGGNPVSCAIGRAVLNVIEEEGLQERCLDIGNYLMQGMRNLQENHAIIGDVRGKGLMTGMELVSDTETKKPASAETAAIFEAMKDRGLLVGKGGLYGNVFRIKPPMCITKDDVDYAIDVMDKSFKDCGF